MKNTRYAAYTVLFFLISSSPASFAEDATTELFELIDKGGCGPSSLTTGTWTITSPPVGTHNELNFGDQLVFEQLEDTSSMSRRSDFAIWKNGALWISDRGWKGSCVRDGSQSLYVVKGDIKLDGCMHELAIGRLDHSDDLVQRVEIVFQDKYRRNGNTCTHGGGIEPRHPGHAHGEND